MKSTFGICLTGHALAFLGLVFVAACSGTNGNESAASGEAVSEATGPIRITSSTEGQVEVAVENALAPFDAATAVDDLMLNLALADIERQRGNECVMEEGFSDVEPTPEIPSRAEMVWIFNGTFPYIEGLARDGLLVLESEEVGPDGETAVGAWAPPPGYVEAMGQCLEDLFDGQQHPAKEIYDDVRVAWEEVLEEIESSDDVQELRDGFSQCLLDEGIPADASSNEFAFLFYVDELHFDAGDDAGRIAEISEQYGRLYVECGRALFEARERLRGGERRTAFLTDHRRDIQELTELLRAEGVL